MTPRREAGTFQRMHTQTLQNLRSEVEAASTLHLALGRIATKANPAAPTAWTGPLLEELEDLTDDDGGFTHAGLAEIRRRSGAALVAQFHAVRAALDGAPPTSGRGLGKLLDATLVTGTGIGTVSSSNGITGVLANLVKSGELRLDNAMRAAMLARDGLPVDATAKAKPAAVKKSAKKPAAKKAATKKAVKKPAAKKAPKKAAAKKPAAKKAAAKKPAAKKSKSKR